MDSGLQQWVDELMAMSPDERTQHFRDQRVKDPSTLPPEAQQWREEALAEARQYLADNPSPPLAVTDYRKRKAV